jgi:hypothetical protein
MKNSLIFFIIIATGVLIALGLVFPGSKFLAPTAVAGKTLPGMGTSSDTAENAVNALFSAVTRHDWQAAYSHVANTSEVDMAAFVRDLAGSDGSLRTYSSLEGAELQPLHATDDQAMIRAKMRWSTAVGPVYDTRDLKVVREGRVWKVNWPVPNFPKVPAQVIPVNYLRWDVIYRNGEEDWGAQNVDTPRVRIVSMNAVQRGDSLVIVGEIVNEDTIPAFVDVAATLLGKDQQAIAQENSFDKVSHTLLPKQVSPYRIDFPGVNRAQVQSVRMDAKAFLIPASADPVIGVMQQRIDTDAQGRKVLKGELVNQSGQTVNIAQVLAAYYDNSGKVIWVSDGYVDRALLPQSPEPFAVDIPNDIASQVSNYRVTVNHYSGQKS